MNASVRQPTKYTGVSFAKDSKNGKSAHPARTPAKADAQPAKPKKLLLSQRIEADLQKWGYDLRLNDMDDSLWNHDRRMDDTMRAVLRTRARDAGYAERKMLAALDDVMISVGANHSFNPARDYLHSLRWDGADHIGRLAGYFTDEHEPIAYADGTTRTTFHAFTLRWLVGAVAKIEGDFDAARANFVLTLVAPQGLGKSHFSSWLCPLPDLFVEKFVNPDDKDDRLLRATSMLWEIGELGSTTKRADAEALKGFFTATTINERRSYGRYNIVKPCVASFLGTVNDAGDGFLVDGTGNRRFGVVEVSAIDRGYSENVDKNQLWAQAMRLWTADPKSYRFSPEESVVQEINNEEQMIPSLMADAVARVYDIDKQQLDWKTSSSEILDKLRTYAGVSRGADRSQGRDLAAALKKYWNIKGKPSNGLTVYRGMRLKVRYENG